MATRANPTTDGLLAAVSGRLSSAWPARARRLFGWVVFGAVAGCSDARSEQPAQSPSAAEAALDAGARPARSTAGTSGPASGPKMSSATVAQLSAGAPAAGSGSASDAGAPTPASGAAGAAAGSGGSLAATNAGAAGLADADGGRMQPSASYYMGADVTDQEPAPPEVRAKLLASMIEHGFNAIRLRTFVDPRAADGYDRENGYADLAHTIEFGKQIKAAGMFLAVDFHYSDNWADPGKQCVPIAWQDHKTISALAAALGEYTRDAITQLVAAGARPDLVQIGNEITPGMLLHRCDERGLPIGDHSPRGSIDNWPNLGALLEAGVDAVRGVDPSILISLHIDRGGDKASESPGSALAVSIDWLSHATQYVQIDAFGESCYQRYQGDPASPARSQETWRATLNGLAQRFPAIKLFAAEYGPAQREINDVINELPAAQGLGTFNWQPTTQGDWNTGHDLWRRSGDSYNEQPDLSLYKQMKLDYAARL